MAGERIRVLNIITGGIMGDGITACWLNFCKAAWTVPDNIYMEFAAPRNLSEEKYVDQFKELSYTIHLLDNRIKTPVTYFKKLVNLITVNGYDIIHVNGSSAIIAIELLAAKICGVKIRVSHSHNTICTYRKLHKLLNPLFKSLTTKNIACGMAAGNWLFGKNKFEVIHNGIFLERFTFNPQLRKRLRAEEGLNDNITIFGHVGKFNEQKNHRFLIDVFVEINRLNPDTRLVLIGEGPLKSKVIDYAKSVGISNNVKFVGETREIPSILHIMDYMIMPSLYEGLPNVVVEWQASGLNAMLSDTITREVAKTDQIVFLPLSYNPKIWAQEILKRRVSQDRLGVSENGIKALKRSGFCISQMVNAIYNIYHNEYNRINRRYQKD